MSDFNSREEHNAELALSGSRSFRHTQPQSFCLLKELAAMMPVKMLAALLDVQPYTVRDWLDEKRKINPEHQRPLHLLHLLVLGTTHETSLFNVACWGHFSDPALKVFTEQHTIILAMLVEMEDIAPYRLLAAAQNRIPSITRPHLCRIIELLMREGKVEEDAATGYWRATRAVREAYKAAETDRDLTVLHEAKSHTLKPEMQPVS